MLLEVAIMPIFDARDYAAQNEWIMPDYARVCDYAGIMLNTNLHTFEVYTHCDACASEMIHLG